jgi:hypothetical protein
VVIPNTTADTFVVNGTWTVRNTSWFTTAKTFAVYTDGGNAAVDFVFRKVELRQRGGS